MTSRKPDLNRALSALSPDVADAVRAASRRFREAGVRHAVCGGVAVSAYARPRNTKDVDFLVGEEAFEHHGAIVSHRPGLPLMVGAVAVDSVRLEPNLRALASLLDAPVESDGIPFVTPEALIAMKLVAKRRQDQVDIISLIESGAVDPAVCRVWLAERGFDVTLFDELAAEAGVR